MKLTKTICLILALIVVFVGWLMIGIGYSVPLSGHLTNTIVFLLSVGVGFLRLIGFIWIVSAKG